MLLLKTTLLLGGLVLCSGLTGCSVEEPEGTARPPVIEATIADIQRDILAGKTSCRDIVAAYLARIEAYDKPAGINAINAFSPIDRTSTPGIVPASTSLSGPVDPPLPESTETDDGPTIFT